jgi:hypothetical protein
MLVCLFSSWEDFWVSVLLFFLGCFGVLSFFILGEFLIGKLLPWKGWYRWYNPKRLSFYSRYVKYIVFGPPHAVSSLKVRILYFIVFLLLDKCILGLLVFSYIDDMVNKVVDRWRLREKLRYQE